MVPVAVSRLSIPRITFMSPSLRAAPLCRPLPRSPSTARPAPPRFFASGPRKSNAALKSAGVASMGATKCCGTILVKGQAQTSSTQSSTCRGLLLSTSPWRMGATKILGLVRRAMESFQLSSQVKPVMGEKSTDSGWKKREKSAVLPHPLRNPSLFRPTTSSLLSMARFSSGAGRSTHTAGGSTGTWITVSVTSSVLVFLWYIATSQNGPSPRGVLSTARSNSWANGTSPRVSLLRYVHLRKPSPRKLRGRLRGKDHCPGAAKTSASGYLSAKGPRNTLCSTAVVGSTM
mmetsp:Transcript_49935/g.159806  ORF Transcript_49935/g.159806 Transcript_49935/m.159806 type:complete len:289 (+) Transcript_49935:163-1029(+)